MTGRSKERLVATEEPIVRGYENTREHLLDELQRIDLLLHREVLRVRQKASGSMDATARLYISEEEVDALVAATGAAAPPVQMDCEECAIVDRLTTLEALIALRKSASLEEGADLRLEQLRKQFQLTAFDINALLISLAPEIDSKYDTLYAYVQDDLTKRRPTVALVLSLLCLSFEAKLSARQRFTASAPLLEHSLLHFVHDASLGSSSLLSRALAVDERIANYLFNGDAIDSRLVPYSQLVTPQGCFATLTTLTRDKTAPPASRPSERRAARAGSFLFSGT